MNEDSLNVWVQRVAAAVCIAVLTAVASIVTMINMAVLSRRLNLERLIREMGKGQ